MLDIFHIIIGLLLAFTGTVFWWQQENGKVYNIWIFTSILLILLGGLNVLYGVNNLSRYNGLFETINPVVKKLNIRDWFFIIGIIFLGTLFYSLAAFYHLKNEKWSFFIALAIAIPLVLIEYQFSLRGNHLAHTLLKLNAVQIAIITIIFYFINAWIINRFILKHSVIVWREILAFMFIILAFVTTTVIT